MRKNIDHLSQLLNKSHNLAETKNILEEQIRNSPEDVEKLWILVQWLCLLEEWPRALKLIPKVTRMQAGFAQSAHVLRSLIQAQQQRDYVFAGNRFAQPVLPWMPWMEQLAQALQHHALGEEKISNELRLTALEQASAWQGQTPLGPCTWLADSDSRLGPICELIYSGSYCWLAWAEIEKLEVNPPTCLLDFMWLPAQVTLKPNSTFSKPLLTFIPVRYPGTMAYIKNGLSAEPQHLSLILGRQTLWQDNSETAICGIGQKTWISDAGDFSLFESRSLTSAPMHAAASVNSEHGVK